MLLSTTTGSETFAATSAKVHAFFMPSTKFPGKELNLHVAAKAGMGITKQGQGTQFACAPGVRTELGQWTSATFDIPEGMLLKLFVHRNPGYGQMRVAANIIIRARSGGAMQRVGAILTGNERASISRAIFEGRFDILSVQQATAEGAVIPYGLIGSYDEGLVNRGFEITVLEPERVTIPTIRVRKLVNSTGEQVAVAQPIRRRAISMD